MGFEPQKLFIGLIDFFAVLLPGAVVTYLWRDSVSRELLSAPAASLVDAEAWIVFLFVSYLIGHLVFLIGSLLDEYAYDWVRGATPAGQIRRLANGEKLSSRDWRWLARRKWLFDSNPDAAVTEVVRLKTRALKPHMSPSAINAFQWCRARLSKEFPEGFAAVQRFEADSKFFRSFTLILLVLPFAFLWRQDRLLAAISASLILPVLWRYMEQRFKATQQAYFHIITLDTSSDKKLAPTRRSLSDKPTKAGGVVFRRVGKDVKFLLIKVDACGKPDEWVLPKGDIEAGESEETTAIREVFEETRYWAYAHKCLGDKTLGDQYDAPLVRFFLMELAEEHEPTREHGDRATKWLRQADAVRLARYPETQKLLGEVNLAELPEQRPPTRDFLWWVKRPT